MATIVETKTSNARIRVALIIEGGKIRPVWFEEVDRPSGDRIHVKEICYTWYSHEGADKVISFAVSDGANSYCLSLNTKHFTWMLGEVERRPFP